MPYTLFSFYGILTRRFAFSDSPLSFYNFLNLKMIYD